MAMKKTATPITEKKMNKTATIRKPSTKTATAMKKTSTSRVTGANGGTKAKMKEFR